MFRLRIPVDGNDSAANAMGTRDSDINATTTADVHEGIDSIPECKISGNGFTVEDEQIGCSSSDLG